MNTRKKALGFVFGVGLLLVACGQSSPPLINFEGSSEPEEAEDKISEVSTETILLKDNFDEGVFDPISILAGDWQLVTGEGGNIVAEIDNLEGPGNPLLRMGEDYWSDYSLHYNFRYLPGSVPESEITLEFHIGTNDLFQVAIGLGEEAYVILGHISSDGSWNTLGQSSFNLFPDEWHSLRLDVTAGRINLYLDDHLLISGSDENSTEGFIHIGVAAGTHAQFDEFLVKALTEEEIALMPESVIMAEEPAPSEVEPRDDSVEESQPVEAAPVVIDSELPAPIPTHLRLIDEDFEDGSPAKFLADPENWTVVENETGNMVYQIDTQDSDAGWNANLGFEGNLLSDYGVEFDFRFLDFANEADHMFIGFFFAEHGYHGALLGGPGISFEGDGSAQDIEIPFLDGEWHTFRFEAQDGQGTVYIDDQKLIVVDEANTQLADWNCPSLGKLSFNWMILCSSICCLNLLKL